MKSLEALKLWYRAYRYQKRNDRGGIAYIHQTVKSGDTVFDIGAHKGGYLYHMMKKAGPTGRLVGFEPQSNLFTYLTEMKNLFHWHHVTLEPVALSDVKGEVTLFIPSENESGASSPGASIVQHKLSDGNGSKETVNTETLDAYCTQHHLTPHFLKIDIEGNELNVLKGGIEILKSSHPKILIEIEERHVGKEQVQETFSFLENLGFKGRFIRGTEYHPLSEFSFEMHQDHEKSKPYCNNFIFDSTHAE